MKLSEWARRQGLSYKTAYRMHKRGKRPVPVVQLATGTLIVQDKKETKRENAALYARVSSCDQRDDLNRQLQRLWDHAVVVGLHIRKEIQEIGYGLNGGLKSLPCIGSQQEEKRNLTYHQPSSLSEERNPG